MERALILHIGHSKTGTTTLQKLVFPQLNRFAFFCKSDTPASAQVEQAFMRSPEIWRAYGDRILNEIRAEMSHKHTNPSVLISSEGISAHKIFTMPKDAPNRRRRDPFLLSAHLSEFRSVAKRAGFDSLKIIMGIRRQDQYLASRYVTNGWLGGNPPYQDDFERQSLEIVDPEKRYFIDGIWLDYKTTLDLIVGIVGENNILVLPVELLGDDPERYFSTLSVFLGESVNGFTSNRKNVRGVAPDIWRIDATAIRKVARKKRFGRVRALLTRDAEISLSPELKSRILAAYRESNQALASAIGVDLMQYGYFEAPPKEAWCTAA
jgi:hypothetical protein